MYASSPYEKMATGVASIGIVALIGYALLAGLAVPIRILAEHSMEVLDLHAPPPPPKESKPPEPQKKAKPMKHEASAESRKAKASPFVAPPMPPLVKPPVIAAPKPNIGAAAKNGASDRAGSGEGAGGEGDGLGGGGDGEGGDTPPHHIKGRLGFSDIPNALRSEGIERTVAVRYTVDITGRVSDCAVTGSSGSPALDTITCQLIEKRFRFNPSRDGSGRPVPSIIVEEHSWRVDRGSLSVGG